MELNQNFAYSSTLRRTLRFPTIVATIIAYALGGLIHSMLLDLHQMSNVLLLAGVAPLAILAISAKFALKQTSNSNIFAITLIAIHVTYYSTIFINLTLLEGGTEMSGLLYVISEPFVLIISAAIGGLLIWTNKFNHRIV